MRTLDHVQKDCHDDGDDDGGLDVHVFGTSLDGFETKPDCLSKVQIFPYGRKNKIISLVQCSLYDCP